mmetsp:Transcript_14944/g.20360  ORF Transcript_14944/g.20360 Transcript_14944/m.20360 type:complete len:164 (+) Transcript_14944:1671-2162(+)
MIHLLKNGIGRYVGYNCGGIGRKYSSFGEEETNKVVEVDEGGVSDFTSVASFRSLLSALPMLRSLANPLLVFTKAVVPPVISLSFVLGTISVIISQIFRIVIITTASRTLKVGLLDYSFDRFGGEITCKFNSGGITIVVVIGTTGTEFTHSKIGLFCNFSNVY